MNFTNIILCIFLMPCASLLAQADALHTYLPTGCYHAGQYEQHKTVAAMDKPLITEGGFAYNCNQGLIWHTQLPIKETIIYRSQGENFIVRADDSVQALDSRIHRVLGKILNNLIGGNSDYLQQTFSIIEHADDIQLTPKNKQMQKFLHSLKITQQGDDIKITLNLAEQETTEIRIFSRRTFESLDQIQCAQLPNLPSSACSILFKGSK